MYVFTVLQNSKIPEQIKYKKLNQFNFFINIYKTKNKYKFLIFLN